MNLFGKISLLIITAGWLAGFHPGDTNQPVGDTVGHDARISGDAESTHFQPLPFLPATLAEIQHDVSEEIEPGSGSPLTRPTGTVPLHSGADYLQISEQNGSFHPALILLFPFHTYL
ncbi:MAG TPA: hypothetical protein VJ915_05185 [Balneolaceae bacterium]|nr:hypothetical protein [Balneolaceae bacterium]